MIMLMFHDKYGYDVYDDPFHKGEQPRPRYLVSTGSVSSGYYNKKNALDWFDYISQLHLTPIFIDLDGYDWEKNPANIKQHKIEDFMQG